MFYIQSNTGKRIDVPGHRGVKYWKLRSPEAVARRRKYKKNKPKKQRIHCKECSKKFIPRRTTAIYCGPLCRNQAHYHEHKYFSKFGLITEWEQLPDSYKTTHSKLGFLRGEFDKEDGTKIMQELNESGATLLILNSLGGLVSEAQMVGYYLRSNNIASMAGEICASACVYALAGSVERYAISESKVGIHRSHIPGFNGSLEDGQSLAGNYIRYFNSMDIDTEIVALASSTSSDNVRWAYNKEGDDSFESYYRQF